MQDNKYADKLIKEYSPKQNTELDELKALDSKVKTPVRVFAYIFGTLGALILGLGMCLAMEIIGNTTALMVLGIIVGLIGIVIVAINYPLYQKVLQKRKNKYSDQIIANSNKLLNKGE